MRRRPRRDNRRPPVPPVTLAQRLLASGGQRLRADETACRATFLVSYRAQWQARQDARRAA